MPKVEKRCPYCDKAFPSREGALECARTHDVKDTITVSFLKEDFQRLVMYLMFGDRQVITERLYTKLVRYYKK